MTTTDIPAEFQRVVLKRWVDGEMKDVSYSHDDLSAIISTHEYNRVELKRLRDEVSALHAYLLVNRDNMFTAEEIAEIMNITLSRKVEFTLSVTYSGTIDLTEAGYDSLEDWVQDQGFDLDNDLSCDGVEITSEYDVD